MGMTIDNTCEPKTMSKEEIVDTLKTMVFGVQAFERFNTKERETLDKAWNLIDQYEARLKADMVAMLTHIQLEIREYHEIGCDEDCNNCRMVGCVEPVNVIKDLDIIQQKINALKENKDAI